MSVQIAIHNVTAIRISKPRVCEETQGLAAGVKYAYREIEVIDARGDCHRIRLHGEHERMELAA
jgi:hypothetical protein